MYTRTYLIIYAHVCVETLGITFFLSCLLQNVPTRNYSYKSYVGQ